MGCYLWPSHSFSLTESSVCQWIRKVYDLFEYVDHLGGKFIQSAPHLSLKKNKERSLSGAKQHILCNAAKIHRKTKYEPENNNKAG